MPIRTISQSINLQKQPDSDVNKYITEITNNGITVHPEGQDNTNYLQIASDVEIVRNGISVAEYGENVRIGKEDSTKVIIADGSISPYTTAGTYIVDKVSGVDMVLASFTASGAQIGQTSESHLEMDYHSLKLTDKEGNNYFYVSDLRDSSGVATVEKTFYGDNTKTAFYFGVTAVDTSYSVTPSASYSGTITKYTDHISCSTAPNIGETITIVLDTESQYAKSYTLGKRSAGDVGIMSLSEGAYNIASGWYSHAEGSNTTASGAQTHAEGFQTVASAPSSHAEGQLTVSSGGNSHAEGNSTTASGANSHAQNNNTIAQRKSQTAIGEFNVADTSGADGMVRGDYAVIVGNGTSDNARSNALTVGWSGNVEAAGDITDGTGNILSDKKPSAYVHMYVANKTLNNTATKLTGLSIIGGGNYEDYFDIGTANQIKIKKAGRYHVEIFMRFSSVTNAANIKRISIYKNGTEGSACLGRVNSYEDVTYWDNITYAAGDILTMYGRSEDGNATVSYPRVMLTPLF